MEDTKATETMINVSDKEVVEEVQGFLALMSNDEKMRFMSLLEGAKVTMLLKAQRN